MNKFVISLADILYVAGALTAIIGAYKLVTKPYKDLVKMVSDNSKKILELYEENEKNQKARTAELKALTAIINHQLDGNDKEGLKKTRDELTEYLVENKGE